MLLETGDAGVMYRLPGHLTGMHLTGMTKSKDNGQSFFNLAENPSWQSDSFFVSRAGTQVGVTHINCMGHARRCNKQVVDTREPSTATAAWCLQTV